ncbi:MAG: hypothetical protein HY735_37970 [Verrucomicrobia bacterium]|nr:hypothetical protein [Verrucomicrobiota bacterium]
MIRSVLLIVTGDPRTSTRPAEAVRIAAGIGAWKMADVSIYFAGPAVLGLSEAAEDWGDGEPYAEYLPILGGIGRPVYVDKGNPFLSALEEPAVAWQELTDVELAQLTARSDYVARFD